MSQLKVIVNKLNKRSGVPANFAVNNIIGTVSKGAMFEGFEVPNIQNPSLGKWYEDAEGAYYWGGGLVALDPPLGVRFNIKDLPIHLPSPCRMGIDISHHNNLPDWQGIVNAGTSFVFLKISEGVGTPDAKAGQNAATAKQHGLKIGYYHFCRPDARNGGSVINDATAEVEDAMHRIAAITTPDLPLVLDLEDQQGWDTPLAPNDYLLWINTFIERIISSTGVPPIIYSRKEYLNRKLPFDHNLGKYKLWISLYSSRDCNKVSCPVGWQDWAMWQYCEDGIIGRNSKLDINIMKDPTLF